MKDEVQYELQKRISIIVSKTNLTQELGQLQLEAALRLIDSNSDSAEKKYRLYELI